MIPVAGYQGHGVGGGHDVAHIRVACLGERGRDADGDGVALGQTGHVGRGFEQAGFPPPGHGLGLHVSDMAPAGVDGLHDLGAHIEPERPESRPAGFHHQRESHVPQADHPDGDLALAEELRSISHATRLSRLGSAGQVHLLVPELDRLREVGAPGHGG